MQPTDASDYAIRKGSDDVWEKDEASCWYRLAPVTLRRSIADEINIALLLAWRKRASTAVLYFRYPFRRVPRG